MTPIFAGLRLDPKLNLSEINVLEKIGFLLKQLRYVKVNWFMFSFNASGM